MLQLVGAESWPQELLRLIFCKDIYNLDVSTRASNEGSRRFHKIITALMLAKPPVPYYLCIGVPISCLLTVG